MVVNIKMKFGNWIINERIDLMKIGFAALILMAIIYATYDTYAFTVFKDELPKGKVFFCRNVTGQFAESSATISCYDSANTLDISAVSMDNLATGKFNYTLPSALTVDSYSCFLNCGVNNPTFSFSLEVKERYANDTDLGGIESDVTLILADTAAYDTDAEYATAIWNALTNAYGGAGTYGQAAEDTLGDTNEIQGAQNWDVWDDAARTLTACPCDSGIKDLSTDLNDTAQYKSTGFSTHSAADVWTAGTRALTTCSCLSSLAQMSSVDNDTLADTNELQTNQDWNVWDDGTRTLTVADWTTDADLTTLCKETSIGTVSGDINTTKGYVDTEVADIKTETDKIPGIETGIGTISQTANDTLTDTAAMDTSGELRTLLTDADSPIATQDNVSSINVSIGDAITRGNAAWATATGFTSQSGIDDISREVNKTNETLVQMSGDINTSAGYIDTEVGDIKTQTDKMPGVITAQATISGVVNSTKGFVEDVSDGGLKTIHDVIVHATYGLSAIKTLIDGVVTGQTTISTDLNDTAQYKATGFSTHSAEGVDTQLNLSHGTGAWTTGSGADNEQLSADINDTRDQVKQISTDVNDTQDYVDTEVANIKTQTDKIPGIITGQETISTDLNDTAQYKATGFSTHSEVDVDTQLNLSHSKGNWSDIGAGASLTKEQIDEQLNTSHGIGTWTTGGAADIEQLSLDVNDTRDQVKQVSTDVNTSADYIDTEVADIKTETDKIPLILTALTQNFSRTFNENEQISSVMNSTYDIVSHATYGLSAIKTLIDGLITGQTTISNDLNTTKGYVDTEVQTILDNTDKILALTEVRAGKVNDASASTTKFISNLTEGSNNFWNRGAVLFTSGGNEGQIRAIKSYVGATKELTLKTPLNNSPSNGDLFSIISTRKFLLPDDEVDGILEAIDQNQSETNTSIGDVIARGNLNWSHTGPTLTEIDTMLNSSHSEGNWSSVGEAAGLTLNQIDARLNLSHSEGNWSDIGAGASLTKEQIDEQLNLSHGTGGWTTGGAADIEQLSTDVNDTRNQVIQVSTDVNDTETKVDGLTTGQATISTVDNQTNDFLDTEISDIMTETDKIPQLVSAQETMSQTLNDTYENVSLIYYNVGVYYSFWNESFPVTGVLTSEQNQTLTDLYHNASAAFLNISWIRDNIIYEDELLANISEQRNASHGIGLYNSTGDGDATEETLEQISTILNATYTNASGSFINASWIRDNKALFMANVDGLANQTNMTDILDKVGAVDTAIRINTTLLETAMNQNFTQQQINISNLNDSIGDVITRGNSAWTTGGAADLEQVSTDINDTRSQVVQVSTDMNDTQDYVDTEVGDIKTETDKIPSILTALTQNFTFVIDYETQLSTIMNTTVGYIDTEVADIKTETDKIPGMITTQATISSVVNSTLGYVEDVSDGGLKSIYDIVAHATYGLSAVKDLVDGLITGQTTISTGVNDTISNQTVLYDRMTDVNASIPNLVWDELLTGSTHNIATSAGRRLREVSGYVIHSGTAQTGNGYSITFAAGASSTNRVYNRNLITLTGGAGAGQTRTIVDYNGTSKIAVIDREWHLAPDATSEYLVVADDTPLVVDHGIAQGGTTNSITLHCNASGIDDTYTGSIVNIMAATGRGEARIITGYDGTTKIATITPAWITNPDATSVYVVMPYGQSMICDFCESALDQIANETDVQLNLSHLGNWSAIGGTPGLTSWQNNTLYGLHLNQTVYFVFWNESYPIAGALTSSQNATLYRLDDNQTLYFSFWNESFPIAGALTGAQNATLYNLTEEMWEAILESNKSANETLSFLYDDLVY